MGNHPVKVLRQGRDFNNDVYALEVFRASKKFFRQLFEKFIKNKVKDKCSMAKKYYRKSSSLL